MVKKHLGILGCKPSAFLIENLEKLFCNNCNNTPEHLSHKDYFYNGKSYDTKICDWLICSDCFTPLKRKI